MRLHPERPLDPPEYPDDRPICAGCNEHADGIQQCECSPFNEYCDDCRIFCDLGDHWLCRKCQDVGAEIVFAPRHAKPAFCCRKCADGLAEHNAENDEAFYLMEHTR